MGKRKVVLLLVFVLTLGIFQGTGGNQVVADETLYFISINDTLPPELINRVSVYNGVVYVPSETFSDYGLGLTYTYFSSTTTACLTTGDKQLFFEMTTGDTYDDSDTHYDMSAILRSGTVYLPLSLVCWFFGGISYSYINGNEYGSILRITTDAVVLSDGEFLEAARTVMRTYYIQYNRAVETAPAEPEPTPTPTPESAPLPAPTPGQSLPETVETEPLQVPDFSALEPPSEINPVPFQPESVIPEYQELSPPEIPEETQTPVSIQEPEPEPEPEPDPDPIPAPTEEAQPARTHLGEHITLSFQGLPSDDVLNVLEEQEIYSCFFLTAEEVRSDPDQIRQMVGKGHSIGIYDSNVDDTITADDARSTVVSLLFEAAHVRAVLLAGDPVEGTPAPGFVWCPRDFSTVPGETGALLPEELTTALAEWEGDVSLRLGCDGPNSMELNGLLRELRESQYEIVCPRETG